MIISEHFNQHFEIIKCRTPATVLECQRLRFQVYCMEHTYLARDKYPDQVECDDYDEYSVHALIRHRASNLFTATARLVLSREHKPLSKFPIENFNILRRVKRDKAWKVPRTRIGEISRFAISKTFRRRLQEKDKVHGITEKIFDASHDDRRQVAEITLGLFKAILEMSAANGITHWYAVMEPSLIRLLAKIGIAFNTVGPLVDYHGWRQPCIVRAEEVLMSIYENNPDSWRFITNNGAVFGTNYLQHMAFV